MTTALAQREPAILVPPLAMREFAARFLEWFFAVRGRSPNTIISYRYNLAAFLEFCEGAGLDHPDRITFREIERYLGWLRHKRGLGETSANHHLHTLRGFWRFLTREGIARANPAADVFPLKEPERLPSYLSLGEQERVLRELAQDHSLLGRRDLALVSLLLLTGLRVSELTHLRVDNIDLEAGTLRVENGKGRKARELPIVPSLAAVLASYLKDVRPKLVQRPRGHLRPQKDTGPGAWSAAWVEDTGRKKWCTIHAATLGEARRALDKLAPPAPAPPWVFMSASNGTSLRKRGAGEPLLTRSVFRIIRRQVARRVGRNVSPHTMRHSFASRLRAAGAPLEIIQEALGHASITTTTMYAHLATPKRLEELTRFLDGGGR